MSICTIVTVSIDNIDAGYETLHWYIWYKFDWGWDQPTNQPIKEEFNHAYIYIYVCRERDRELHCHITLCVTISFINYRKFSNKFKQLHIQIYYQNFANHQQLYPGTISELRLQILICKWLVFVLLLPLLWFAALCCVSLRCCVFAFV